MTQIKDVLLDLNVWWNDPFKIEFKHRDIYESIKKFVALPQMISLTGLRRVGKTTLLLKIVEDSISEGMNPKNIMYFSFDNMQGIEIRAVLKVYEEITENNMLKGKYLFIFDEVQKVDRWEEQVKSLYDLVGKN